MSRILFLYPHPGEPRLERYLEASRVLQEVLGHQVTFVYVGPPRAIRASFALEHFDAWVDANRDRIREQSLIQLERELPNSNLWRGIVAQRTFADYSYVGPSYPVAQYRLEELEFYLKAVVLFYRELIERAGIELAVAQAPDAIHAQILFELAPSLGFVALNQSYDPYWNRGSRYPIDQVGFRSTALEERYRRYHDNYDALIRPREKELEDTAQAARDRDPVEVVRGEGWPTTLGATVRTATRGFVRAWPDLCWTRPDIVEGYYRRPFWTYLRGFFWRMRNLAARRLLLRFEHEPPQRPYVFFAPHYQPEATTLASAPVWSDMLALARMLSASLPAGYQLVVKDHPMIGGYRAASFYRELQRLPNVVVLPEHFPTAPLLNGAALVVNIGGTAGLQGLLHGKPVLLLGSAYYDCVTGILRPPADLNQLPMMLKRVLVLGELPSAEERRRSLLAFLAAYRDVMTHNPAMEHPSDERERGRGYAELVDLWIKTSLAERLQAPRPGVAAGLSR